MANRQYTDEELERYFNDPAARKGRVDQGGTNGNALATRKNKSFWYRRFKDPRKAQAATVVTWLAGFLLLLTVALVVFLLVLRFGSDLPDPEVIANPDLQLATVAYTADGEELQRYAFQNRSMLHYDEISPHVVNALIAVEDHRFYEHWGMDLFRTFSAVVQTVFDKVGVPGFRTQGGSTITQQLARNLFNEQIGREQNIGRKLKEWITAVELERRFTKKEIIEMYLNTVEFGYNSFGIETAAKTFFGKTAAELNVEESAVLVGMQKAPTYYNPVRNPENAKRRRNVVMLQMVRNGFITREYYDEHKDEPIVTDYNSSEITAGIAPYFAEYVRNWLNAWAKAEGRNLYEDGLVVYTTLDSRLQEVAQDAVQEQMKGLQAVVDYEWSRASGYSLGSELAPYVRAAGYEPFGYFWKNKRDLVTAFMKDTDSYRALRKEGRPEAAALSTLRNDAAFMDSLKATKTRLEAALLSIDPRTGYVKAWVGGRDLATDWYDHVATAKRQPGSTFKPFVYTAAIDNGYSPSFALPDCTFTWRDPESGAVWQPGNFGGQSGAMVTLREALATSNNLITARLMSLIGPRTVAQYAHNMGIKSDLDEVMALALGTSDVSLLELTSAYATLADGGLYHEPTVVTRIQDRFGNVLYEAEPVPEEALSEETAYTVVDMLRGGVRHPNGTGSRLSWQWGLGDYDIASKTGTTQESADGWLMLLHPDLVTGAWVGFNDRRIVFRSNYWGQGAHNALFLVGDYFKRAVALPDTPIMKSALFPSPAEYTSPEERAIDVGNSDGRAEEERDARDPGRVAW